MVGLASVDDTSDANKPISTATQTALDGKQNTISWIHTSAPEYHKVFTGASSFDVLTEIGSAALTVKAQHRPPPPERGTL